MKIGDVKVGAVLALDANEKYGRDLPRIAPVEETYWQSLDTILTLAERGKKAVE